MTDVCINILSIDKNNNLVADLYLNKDLSEKNLKIPLTNVADYLEDLIASVKDVVEIYIRENEKQYGKNKYAYSRLYGEYPYIRISVDSTELYKHIWGCIWYSFNKNKPLLSLSNERIMRAIKEEIMQ